MITVPIKGLVKTIVEISGPCRRTLSMPMNDGDLGFLSPTSNPRAQPWTGSGNCQAGVQQGGKLVNQSGKSGK